MTRSLLLIPPTTVAVLRAMEIILAYIAQVGTVKCGVPSLVDLDPPTMECYQMSQNVNFRKCTGTYIDRAILIHNNYFILLLFVLLSRLLCVGFTNRI